MTHRPLSAPADGTLSAEQIEDIEAAGNAAADDAMPEPEGIGTPQYEARWDEAERIGYAAYLTVVRDRCAELGITVEQYFTERDELFAQRARAAAAFRIPLSARGVLAGQAISSGTHYIIDRRRPLRLLAGAPVLAARRLPVRSQLRRFVVSLSGLPYYRINAEALDQAAHLAFVTLGGAVTVAISSRKGR